MTEGEARVTTVSRAQETMVGKEQVMTGKGLLKMKYWEQEATEEEG